jgi:hypothetical protein
LTLPANVRVNTNVPFPSLVIGSGPVTVSKNFGIWTIGFSITNLATAPGPINSATDLLIAWNSVSGNFYSLPISALVSSARAQRSITGPGNLPITTNDQILNVKSGAPGLNITVPLASTRSGTPLTFNFVPGGQSFTLTATGPDTLDGLAAVVLNNGGITLMPYNDGANNALGYAIE